MVKKGNMFVRGIAILLIISILAIPRHSAEARHWMLADLRIWTVLRACTDGVIAIIVHQSSADPNFTPGPNDQPAWVELGVRKITNPAAPLPDIQGNLMVTPDTYNPAELVPFQQRDMTHHTDPLAVDTGDGAQVLYYLYAFVELTWSSKLDAGSDQVIVVGGKLNQPDAFTGMVATVENCRVSQFEFQSKPFIHIDGSRFSQASPHLLSSLPLYHGVQPGLGVVQVNGQPSTNTFTFRQHDVDSGGLTYTPTAKPFLQNDMFTFNASNIVLESTLSNGAQADNGSGNPKISRDGRFIAFTSTASNLPGGNGVNYEIYLRDRDADGNGIFDEPGGASTVLISKRLDGTGSESGLNNNISGDGRSVVFYSSDSNMVPDDTNGQWDIFVWENGVIQRVSLATDGTQSNSTSLEPIISENGRYVAFSSYATNLVPGISDSVRRIYLRDRDTDNNAIFDEPGKVSTVLISRNEQGDPANNSCYDPTLSADGRYVVFDSRADNLVPGDTNGQRDIFLYDRVTDHIERISLTWDGQEANGDSTAAYSQAISDDGRFVVFRTSATNLLADGFDNNGVEDIYVRDRASGQIRLISYNYARSEPAHNGTGSWDPFISANGRWIAFYSDTDDLVLPDQPACPNNTNCSDIFVFDQETNDMLLVTTNMEFAQGNGYSYSPSLSGDGSFITFSSGANNLVPGDTNNTSDIFAAYVGFPVSFPILAKSQAYLPMLTR